MTLSTATIQQLHRLYETQGAYQPNSAIRATIANKSVVAVVGATCMGKNTVMQAAIEQDAALASIGRRTSREPRSDDPVGLYTYIPGTDEGLAAAFAQIQRGEWVNYAVNTYANLLYGSGPGDYPASWSLGDIFASAIPSMRNIGFKQVLAVSVVCEPELWIQRVTERFPAGHPQRQARIEEAIASLEWSLAQTTDHYWAVNTDTPAAGGEQLRAIMANPPTQPDEAARHLAQACLAAVRKLGV